MSVVRYECGCIGISLDNVNYGTCILISNCEGVGTPMSIDKMNQKIDRELTEGEIIEATKEIRELIEDGKHLRKLKCWMQED